jgi:hypothetical protein
MSQDKVREPKDGLVRIPNQAQEAELKNNNQATSLEQSQLQLHLLSQVLQKTLLSSNFSII